MRNPIWTPETPAYGPNAATRPSAKATGPEILIPSPVVDPYADAEWLRTDRHAGHIVIDGVEKAMTLQCCHCGGHWMAVKGSKRNRGFCTRCSQVTCGDAKCDPCIPFEQKLDLYESGRLAVLR